VNLGNLIVGRVAVLLGHQVFVVEQTGSVVQEMANSDGLSVGGELGKDLGERLVVAEFTVMDEEHDSHGGELLGNGRDAEICVFVNFVERAEVSYAIAALEDRAVIFDDNDSRTG